jgi:hypothetical protein
MRADRRTASRLPAVWQLAAWRPVGSQALLLVALLPVDRQMANRLPVELQPAGESLALPAVSLPAYRQMANRLSVELLEALQQAEWQPAALRRMDQPALEWPALLALAWSAQALHRQTGFLPAVSQGRPESLEPELRQTDLPLVEASLLVERPLGQRTDHRQELRRLELPARQLPASESEQMDLLLALR